MEASSPPADAGDSAERKGQQTIYDVWVTRAELLGAAQDVHVDEETLEETVLPVEYAALDLLYLGRAEAWGRDAAGRGIFEAHEPEARDDFEASSRHSRVATLLERIDRKQTVTVMVAAAGSFGEVEVYAEVERKLKSGRRA